MDLDRGETALVVIINLVEQQECQLAYSEIVSLQRQEKRVYLVIAGGDGSLITTLMSAKDAGVDIRSIPACVLPYGTGNDFAFVTKWGRLPTDPIYNSLNHIAAEICHRAHPVNFNVWNVYVRFKNG